MLTAVLTETFVAVEPAPLREVELVSAARGGDMRAFERLYRLHSGKIMGLCMRMTRHRDTAEECVQKTFIQAWRNLPNFEARSAFGTWLHRIAVNEVLSQSRGQRRRAENDDEFSLDQAIEAHPREPSVGDIMDLEQALATLPEGCRHVVVLQAIYGHSHEEVATMLGIAVGTCKAQLHRGRRLLRERMGWAESDDE